LPLKHRFTVRDLTAAGAAAGLALILGYLRLYRMPQGGAITLASVPILYLALWRGPRVGVLAGLMCGLLNLVGGYVIHPVQLVLDYPLPLAALGLAGLTPSVPRIGILTANALRCASHVASGVVFFASFAPEGMPVWHYALIYNLSFILPEAIIGLLAVPPILRRLGHATQK